MQPAGGDIRFDQFVQSGLVNRNLAGLESGDLAFIRVHAGDFDAEFGETGAGHEADIAGADHDYVHSVVTALKLKVKK